MAQVLLYCPEPLGLTLGPSPIPEECIRFRNGFARFDDKDYPLWKTWLAAPGTPLIEVLDSDSAQVPDGTPGSFACPVCGKAFQTAFAQKGHLKSHAPRG